MDNNNNEIIKELEAEITRIKNSDSIKNKEKLIKIIDEKINALKNEIIQK